MKRSYDSPRESQIQQDPDHSRDQEGYINDPKYPKLSKNRKSKIQK